MAAPSAIRYSASYDALQKLALDLHWSWSHDTDIIWRKLDPILWELTHNPYVVLQTVSAERINEVLDDAAVRELVRDLLMQKQQHDVAPAWFQRTHAGSPLNGVAYFCMEFMLSEALPIYSGGLGNVAGDHLKAASDLGVPVIGVGLLYQQGYSRQVIDEHGMQQYLFPYNDPGQLPITELRNEKGEWLRIELALPGYPLWLRAWKVQVGRVMLLLLDSNDAANLPRYRTITSELYGGGPELRLAQEMVLGIGGWQLLEALGLQPEVMHLNEGHSAFAILERASQFMKKHDVPFNVALAATRAGNIFTSHTAIGAGFDCFAPGLIEAFLGGYIRENLKISVEELLALGRANPRDEKECFNVAWLAARGSAHINGVSKIHGQVCKRVFAPLFKRWPLPEVPVGAVTNGVHMSTWDSPEADALWTEACGKERWLGNVADLEQRMRAVPLEKIWHMRRLSKKRLVNNIRMRYTRQLLLGTGTEEDVEKASHIFNPETLTLGFARRFIEYKRNNLLLRDPDRLQRLLTNPQRPVQLVIAGKPHSRDKYGQHMVYQWIQFIRERRLQQHVIFLSDYDMGVTDDLVQGVDVWINTPRRPWEACGTSGMKVLVNGGLNLSVRDGWWDEAYHPDLGWAITAGNEKSSIAEKDAADAAQLYQLLEEEVVPEYYTRNEQGLPERWVYRIRESMARLTPAFSANRCLREYLDTYYLPAAEAYTARAAQHAQKARDIAAVQEALEKEWPHVNIVHSHVDKRDSKYFYDVAIHTGKLAPDAVRVEIFADPLTPGGDPFRYKMEQVATAGNNTFRYTASINAERPVDHYTIRILPRNDQVAVPLECPLIVWER